jgi:hypothetical protein
MFTITSENYAGNRQTSYTIMKMQIFGTQGKAKTNMEIGGS